MSINAQDRQKAGPEKFRTLIEFIESGQQAPEVLSAPLYQPEGTRNGLTFYYNRAGFDAAFPGLPVEGFENGSMPNASVDAIPHPLDEFSNNLYFSPGDILPGIRFMASNTHTGDEIAVLGATFSGAPSKTAVANFFSDYYRILFNPPVYAAGMDLQSFLGAGWCTVEVYDNVGALLGTDVSAANATGVFWGVSGPGLIGEIRIIDQGGGAEGADNIAFGGQEVPLSDYAIFIGIGLILAFAVIRFRRAI